jgi:hypothetical protein
MAARALACVAAGLLMTACPFLLEDDYVIADGYVIDHADAGAPEPEAGAVLIDDTGDCPKKGGCHADECRGKDCEIP